jgi:hypothetical protein
MTRVGGGGLGSPYPAINRLSRATHRWSLQINGRRVPASRLATETGLGFTTAEAAFFVELGLKLHLTPRLSEPPDQ